jgi:hypothetical protein
MRVSCTFHKCYKGAELCEHELAYAVILICPHHGEKNWNHLREVGHALAPVTIKEVDKKWYEKKIESRCAIV